MCDHVTDLGRAALRRAGQEAHRLRHDFVRSEHLLAALLRDERNAAVAVLSACGIDTAHVLAALDERTVPFVEEFVSLGRYYPLTPSVQAVLHRAFDEARSFGHDSACTEHLLLGLLHEAECAAARVLTDFGLTLRAAREAVTARDPFCSPVFIVESGTT